VILMTGARPRTQVEEQESAETKQTKGQMRAGGRRAEIKYSLYLLRKNPLVLAGTVISLGSIILGLLADYIVNPKLAYPANVKYSLGLCWNNSIINWHLLSVSSCPKGAPLFPLGTDFYGRDLLKMMILAIPLDLQIAFTIVLSAFAIGIVFGSISAYAGGIIDEVILRITDIFFALPVIIFALVVVVSLPPPQNKSVETLTGVVLLIWWPLYVRLVRSQVLAEKGKPYAEALKAIGAGRMRILFRHIVPNSIYPVIVQLTLDVGGVILTFSTLMFIGLTPSPLLPELGNLSNQGLMYVNRAPWLIIFPGLAILIIALGFNLLGDGIRDVLDPRQRR
jgi:peptide/nickel transport system permease protein